MTEAQELLISLAEKHPAAGNQTIARLAYKQAPSLWNSLEAARAAIRRMRTGNRAGTRVIKHLPPTPLKEHGPFEALPEGLTQLVEWDEFPITGATRTLILSDIHIPYHDRAALLVAAQYGYDNKADTVILNGDTADFFSVSFWEKDPRKRNFGLELNTVHKFLELLRATFPKARIIFKLGNHEERWIRYMRVKAPELLGVDRFEFKELFQLDKFGIELVEDKRVVKLGALNILHGHEYRFAISNPVNPARGLFLRCKAHAICGHFHQSSHHTEKTVEQKIIATWSTGCLCDLHPEYAPLNNWVHGFAFVESMSDGKFNVQNKVIRNGKVY
jgi:predicted phosphodiesterase